ncbi:MAG: sulfatase-like hydrolase/transferase [Planctomycetota bacterium]|nr:sulfatase-like hydrolase/transferase [Planctomycetota bacterium]
MRFIALVGVLLACACTKPRPGIPPRHLLLVTCETMRADHTSAYLSLKPTTSLPATETERRENRAMGLDHLAASGVVFRTCTSPSPRTVPALASLFTGVSPRSARVETNDERVPADVPTLAELFVDSGFRTGAFVTRSPSGDIQASLARGFDEFTTCADDSMTVAVALAWLTDDPGDGSRRFTWVHLAGATLPFDRGAHTIDVEELLARKDFGDVASDAEIGAGVTDPNAFDETQVRRFADRYGKEIARTTLALARLLQESFDYTRPGAEASEVWARTVFAFTAPNGMALGEDGAIGHVERCHDGMLRVPLVLRHPDSLTGERVSDAVVELADLLPTFVEWFDLATPAHVEGRSLLALLDSYVERPFERRPTVSRIDETAVSVRDERWHLVVEKSVDGRSLRLFEPAHDPAEREDVSGAHPDVVRRLAAAAERSAPPRH